MAGSFEYVRHHSPKVEAVALHNHNVTTFFPCPRYPLEDFQHLGRGVLGERRLVTLRWPFLSSVAFPLVAPGVAKGLLPPEAHVFEAALPLIERHSAGTGPGISPQLLEEREESAVKSVGERFP